MAKVAQARGRTEGLDLDHGGSSCPCGLHIYYRYVQSRQASRTCVMQRGYSTRSLALAARQEGWQRRRAWSGLAHEQERDTG